MVASKAACRILLIVVCALALSTDVWAQGRLDGRITRPDGTGISGVLVSLTELQRDTVSDGNGAWVLSRVPEGAYTVLLTLAEFSDSQRVTVSGATTTIDRTLDWNLRFTDTIVVAGATRRNERLIETPASASIITSSTIARDGGHGVLPKLLQAAPGVEVVQSGVYDYNLNLRGFNAALNRRVLTLIDGRDPGGVLLGAQEWTAYAVPFDEIAQIEVIKGPTSALYGANAFNGVISILSKEPRFNLGGRALVTFGERGTVGVTSSHSGAVGRGWHYRVFGTASRTDDFYVSRVDTVEYPGLPLEAVAPLDHTSVAAATARLDRDFGASGLWTIEGGTARVSGNMYVTGIGRAQNDSIHRPWARTEWRRGPWQASGFVDTRIGSSIGLGTGVGFQDNSLKARAEVLRRADLVDARVRLTGGGSATYERIDTSDDTGAQTILNDVRRGHQSAVFGQVDYDANARLTLVAAARVDDASTHDVQLSPKVGAAVHLAANHTLRAGYGRAFQPATFGELYVRVPVAPPVPLGPLEAALAPALGGIALGFSSVPILALGNDRLDVEHVNGAEIGYSGVFGRQVLVSGEYYYGRLSSFISALLPQLGTSLGRVNPAYGPYSPPATLNAQQQALVLGTLAAVLPPELYALMSNDADGSPIFAAASYTNVGSVDTQGVDLSVQYSPVAPVMAELTYSWFDFDVRRDLPDDPLSSNTAPHRLGLGISYTSAPIAVSIRYRWSDSFTWATGIFRGVVPAYGVVDLGGTLDIGRRGIVRVNVANLLDNRHYEMFGGDLLRRRAVVDLGVKW
jgi:iron complex outermembrane receptor protein